MGIIVELQTAIANDKEPKTKKSSLVLRGAFRGLSMAVLASSSTASLSPYFAISNNCYKNPYCTAKAHTPQVLSPTLCQIPVSTSHLVSKRTDEEIKENSVCDFMFSLFCFFGVDCGVNVREMM